MIDLPLVSIIIPLYNAEKYIAIAIQSGKDQTWKRKEIIIVDDGSTDNSLKIAKSFENENILVLTQNNQGASAARNLGLRSSRGKYIQFLDADDLLSPNKIESQLSVLKDLPDHIGLCGTVYFNDGEDPKSQVYEQMGYSAGSDNPIDFILKLYGGNSVQSGFGGMIQPNAWLTPRLIIDKAGLWNPGITLDDDGEFFCRVILASKGIKFSHDGRNYYRKFKNGTNLSSLNNRSKMESLYNSWILKRTHLLESTNDSRLNKVLSRNFTELYFVFYNKDEQLREKVYKILLDHGGLTHLPYFGNQYLNKLKLIMGWKFCFLLQRIYSSISMKSITHSLK